MNDYIDAAAKTHSPQHAGLFRQACAGIHERDIRGHAAAIRKVCETQGISAMENPYPGKTQGRTEWSKGWAGEDDEAPAIAEAPAEAPPTGSSFHDKVGFPNKDSIVAYVATQFGVTLDSRDFTRKTLEARAAEIEAAA